MPKSAVITLTTAGTDTGPFNLLSDVDSYTSPFESNVAKSSLIAGYTTNLVPDAATIIRVQSTSSLCSNYIDLNYPTTTTTTTTTTSTTTTTTTTAGPQLYVYAKYVNSVSPGDLQYQINTGSQQTIGAINTSTCNYYTTISGLTSGDTVTFSDDSTRALAGDNCTSPGCSVCPSSGFGCTYQVTIVDGDNFVYLTIDGSNVC